MSGERVLAGFYGRDLSADRAADRPVESDALAQPLGGTDVEELLAETIEAAKRPRVIKASNVKRVI